MGMSTTGAQLPRGLSGLVKTTLTAAAVAKGMSGSESYKKKFDKISLEIDAKVSQKDKVAFLTDENLHETLKRNNERLTKFPLAPEDYDIFRNTDYVMKGQSWKIGSGDDPKLDLNLEDPVVADAKCLGGMILLEALLQEVPGYHVSKDNDVLVHGNSNTQRPSADLTDKGYDQHYQAHLIIFDKWVEGAEEEQGWVWVYPVIIIVNPDGSVTTTFGKPMKERLLEWELAAYEDMLHNRDEWEIGEDDD